MRITPDTATPPQVAESLHITTQSLAQMRYRGTGPKFIKAGPRKVLYRWSDVNAWLDANVHDQTGAITA